MSDVYSVDVEITAPVNDTEVTDRVADAITNLFPGADVEGSVSRTDESASSAERRSADSRAAEPRDDGESRERSPGELRATTHTMDRFAEQLHEREILDTARRQFHERRQGDRFTFALKKQAAFEGVVTFSVGEPPELGDIHVSVRVNEPDVESFVDQIAPRTEDGVPVDSEER